MNMTQNIAQVCYTDSSRITEQKGKTKLTTKAMKSETVSSIEKNKYQNLIHTKLASMCHEPGHKEVREGSTMKRYYPV